jgi:hypothetical protein
MKKISFNPNLIVFIFISLFFTKSVISQQSIGNTAVNQNFDTSIFINAYILSDVKAMNRNSNYTQSELNQFSIEAATDYNNFHFVIYDQISLMYIIN